MTRKQWILMGLLAAAALFVATLALRTRKPPFLPDDAVHREFTSGEACLSCHGPGGSVPQPKEHPLGNDCMRCHASR